MFRRPARTYIRPFRLDVSEGSVVSDRQMSEVSGSQSTCSCQVSHSHVANNESVVRTAPMVKESPYAVVRVFVEKDSNMPPMIGHGICNHARSEPAQQLFEPRIGEAASFFACSMQLGCSNSSSGRRAV